MCGFVSYNHSLDVIVSLLLYLLICKCVMYPICPYVNCRSCIYFFQSNQGSSIGAKCICIAFYDQGNFDCNESIIYTHYCYLPPRRRPGMGDLATAPVLPPVRPSVHLSVDNFFFRKTILSHFFHVLCYFKH